MDDSCTECRFSDYDEENDGYRCCRNPPQVIYVDDGELATVFPLVHDSMVCGEFLQRLSS